MTCKLLSHENEARFGWSGKWHCESHREEEETSQNSCQNQKETGLHKIFPQKVCCYCVSVLFDVMINNDYLCVVCWKSIFIFPTTSSDADAIFLCWFVSAKLVITSFIRIVVDALTRVTFALVAWNADLLRVLRRYCPIASIKARTVCFGYTPVWNVDANVTATGCSSRSFKVVTNQCVSVCVYVLSFPVRSLTSYWVSLDNHRYQRTYTFPRLLLQTLLGTWLSCVHDGERTKQKVLLTVKCVAQ